jgi:predicted helicase
VSDENVERIRRQNLRKISVIIGNPPYNANQLNENENNKNREYPDIDKRIKETYIEASTAQKTKLYDMYARFLRWASDRVDENGVVAFISNSSFIDARTFDGFRRVVAREFNEIWIIDLKGNARTSGERRRQEGGNAFDDQIRVGVAVYFLVKKKGLSGCRIFYDGVRDYAKSEEKRDYLASTALSVRRFHEVHPDRDANWIKLADNDFDSLLPLATKAAKLADKPSQEKALFKLYSLGIVTNRDEWVYSEDDASLASKVAFLVDRYNAEVAGGKGAANLGSEIKWTRAVKRDLERGVKYSVDLGRIQESLYRPFVKRRLYMSREINEMQYQIPDLFGPLAGENRGIAFSAEERVSFGAIALDEIPNKDIFMPSAAQVVCQWRYEGGQRIDNITDWGLDQFKKHYTPGREKAKRPITKDAIFHYVYGVLHDPVYREKYALNLKREFPRIPFYPDFWTWAAWGEELMNLHIGYETVEPAALKRTDVVDPKTKDTGTSPKVILKADKEAGRIVLDSETTLSGIPEAAWDYRLGNRCAVEWILDQYKEKKPKDPTIREKFNTYRFADYKEKVIDLLTRVPPPSAPARWKSRKQWRKPHGHEAGAAGHQ